MDNNGLLEVIPITSHDYTYESPWRAANVSKIHNLYEDKKADVQEALGQTRTVALTGDYWTSLGNHRYLRVTADYFDARWSDALTVMKTEGRNFADVCAGHYASSQTVQL